MTKEEAAKVLAIKYELDYNTFKKSDRFKEDLMKIRGKYLGGGDEEFSRLFDKYVDELRFSQEIPFWARQIMAERYALNI